MSKKNFFIICLQILVIGVFVTIALGSGSQKSAVQNTHEARGFAQGFACGVNGFVMVSTESSQSACIRTCDRKGYSAYCYGDEGGCFCK